ncbi:polysaccharide lyase 6 family protein [Photobacterium lutimaris]|uniref:Alginate lyase n=1 Tax=Photobacterium lutimaris TaxID=388278 RepID=A0A2T3IYG3_9GAMM|nr:polysaccharide lyase 6 family protein [Photobacterium lutimaris]PSU33637.1 alginate lyase [Photobacterium lutimaris]TDR74513.1 poly(beta-D-mannuronate) lyase [Photobacterium lutimaris]
MKKHTPITLALLAALSFNVHATQDSSASVPVQRPENAVEPSVANVSLQSLTAEQLVEAATREVVDIASVESANEAAVKALKQQLENAKSGEVITIAPGRYANLGVVNLTADDITVKAEQAGTVLLTGLVQLVAKGDDITLDSLVFTEGGPAERFGGVRLEGMRNTLQNSTFYYFNDDYTYEPDERRSEYPRFLWVSLWGKDSKVVNNRFEGKHKRGTLIGIQKNIDDKADNHLIEGNIFYSQKKNRYNELAIKEAVRYNGNSWEAIRIGDSKSSQWPSRTQFVNNLLVDSDGERELISIKSGENRIAGNTIFESAAMISLRHGKANTVENNVIIGNNKQDTGGIRIYDENHVVRNNYLVGLRGSGGQIAGNADVRGGVVINTGIIDVKNNEQLDQAVKGKELNKQWTPKNVIVENNTMVDVEFGMVHGNQGHRVSLFDNSQVETVFTGDKIQFSQNVVYNLDETLQALRADLATPLTEPMYSGETYFGQVHGIDGVPEGVSQQKPNYTKVGDFYQFAEGGADVSKLHVLTADEIGPSYRLKAAPKS